MLTGPTATAPHQRANRSLALNVRKLGTLLEAWHAIRRNGETSRSRKTREDIKLFGADLPRKLRSIHERLRNAPYEFSKQIGATPQKAKGKGKRPIVVAPIEDRIVQRAILDVLQDAKDLPDVRQVLATPTSIGGIRGRGVEHAIALIEEAHDNGNANFVAGSDISGFFTTIRQSEVVSFIRAQTNDDEFVELFAHALKVELSNASEIAPVDLAMFPTDDVGVAQGCPLSAFAGNVVLRDFDTQLNGRGITCIRYIDDFILLGRNKRSVEKAFQNAGEYLSALGMSIYKPTERPDKAFMGPIDSEFEFLGYQIVPGVYPPAPKNRERIVEAIREELDQGRAQILRTLHRGSDGRPLQLYSQTLVTIDRLLRAWNSSFRASRCMRTAQQIDETVNELIGAFIAFYRDKIEGYSRTDRRRVLGIYVLADEIQRRLNQTTNGRKTV